MNNGAEQSATVLFSIHKLNAVNTSVGCNARLGPEVKMILVSLVCKSSSRLTHLQFDIKIVMM